MSEDNCPICKDVFSDKVMHEPCKHEFCKSCLDRWYLISDKRSCPLCRTLKKSEETEINSYFESQNEIHGLNFTVEHQTEDFPIREDSLNLIFHNSNDYYDDCLFKAHPKTLKMFLENNIDILINVKIRSYSRTCVQIKMNLDEILSDGIINIKLKLNGRERALNHEITIKKNGEFKYRVIRSSFQ